MEVIISLVRKSMQLSKQLDDKESFEALSFRTNMTHYEESTSRHLSTMEIGFDSLPDHFIGLPAVAKVAPRGDLGKHREIASNLSKRKSMAAALFSCSAAGNTYFKRNLTGY
jgi:hypothetical protein